MEKSLRLKSDGLSPSGWPLTRPQRNISTQTRLCRSLTAGRRYPPFAGRDRTAVVDPEPSFTTSPADGRVGREAYIRTASQVKLRVEIISAKEPRRR